MSDNKKSDLVSYVETQTSQDFSEKPFHTTDGLVLAELAYIHWEDLGIDYPGDGSLTLQEAIARLSKEYRSSLSADFRELLTAAAESERFGNMRISNYYVERTTIEEAQSQEELKQFAAVTFTYTGEDGSPQNYLSYRGTDATLEGWCEDFNMAYDSTTEAQRTSVKYMNDVANKLEGGLRLGGHSKGGNHALYAYLFCSESARQRIEKLYNYDGPGFMQDLCYVDDEGNVTKLNPEIYQKMLGLLSGSAVCPYDSIIGQLLSENAFVFADTTEELLLDHDAFTWSLDSQTGEFIVREQSSTSKYIDEVFDDWVLNLPEKNRKSFMTAIWGWIYSIGVEDFDELGIQFKEDWKGTIGSLFSYINSLPEEQKKEFIGGLSFLGVCIIDNFLEDKMPGYATIKEKVLSELKERGIHSPRELWNYLKEDPIKNTLDLLQSLLLDWDTLAALVQATVTVAIAGMILKVVIVLLQSTLSLVIFNLPIIAAVLGAIVVFALAVDFIREHWDEFVNFLDQFQEYLQEKISEFVEAMKLAIVAGANLVITRVLYQAENIVEMFDTIKDQTIDVLQKLGSDTTKSLKNVLRISNPLLYTAIRTILGYTQPPVIIDMNRLQNAVDQMDRLAGKVGALDRRLDSLYGKLCIGNIEQAEGILTSLANMYHLSRADINVDEGNQIRRKAEAIGELFQGYKDVERWAISQIGG